MSVADTLRYEYETCRVFVNKIIKHRQEKLVKHKIQQKRQESRRVITERVKSYKQEIKLSQEETLNRQLEKELSTISLDLIDN